MILRFVPSAIFALGGAVVWLAYQLLKRLGGMSAGDGAGYHGRGIGGPWILYAVLAYFVIGTLGALPFVRHPMRVLAAKLANAILALLAAALGFATFSALFGGEDSPFPAALILFIEAAVFFGPFILLWRWLLRWSASKEQPPT